MNEFKAMATAELKAEKFAEIFKGRKTYDALDELSLEELKEINVMVVEMIKRKRDRAGLDVKKELSIGDLVSVKNEKDSVYEVTKINRKNAVIKNENGKLYNCPFALLEVI